MFKRSTWIFLFIFLALLALLMWLPRFQDKLVQPTVTPTVSEKLFDFLPSDVASVRVVSAQGLAFDVQRDSDSLWLITGVESMVDSTAIEGAVNQAVNATISAVLEDASDLEQYGLAYPPAYTVTFTMQDGTQHIIVLGDVTPTERGYYVQLANDSLVVLSKSNLDTLLGFLEELPIVTPTPEIIETVTP